MARVVYSVWLTGAMALGQPALFAQGGPALNSSPATNASAATNLPMDTPIREITPGVFQLGDVKIDKNLRTVSFPARLNLYKGPMEYFLVTSWGKIHESVLRTDTQPYRIHVGMLLLGAHGAGTNGPEADLPPTGFISHPANIQIPGDDVIVEVVWSTNGTEIRRPAGELVYNLDSHSPVTNDDWAYNGSRMYENDFIAEADGSIVSLVTDWAALINNNGPGHDDSIWTANTNQLPPTNVTVQVILKLKEPAAKK